MGFFTKDKVYVPKTEVKVPPLTENQRMVQQLYDRVATDFERDPKSYVSDVVDWNTRTTTYKKGNIILQRYWGGYGEGSWEISGMPYMSGTESIHALFSQRITLALKKLADYDQKQRLLALTRTIDNDLC